MTTIIISGFMGTGKSTLAPLVAARLGVPVVDTDKEIASQAGKNIATLFREEGEPAFRARERALIETLLDGVPRVVAVGGGALVDRVLRRRVLESARVVTLSASVETIAKRLAGGDRPLLGTAPHVDRIASLLELRKDAYAECHLTLPTDTSDPDSLTDDIVALAKRDVLVVPLGQRSYVIELVHAHPDAATDAIARLAPSRLILVSDTHVMRARGAALGAALSPLVAERTDVVLPSGEMFKTLASVQTIWDVALGAGAQRDAVIVAFGGGVVGDLAGFAASTFLRGVRYVQIPTTLLAMVDSSIGGKTGFDHPAGKNLIGTFYQPSAVAIDLDHLATLPRRQRAAGLAEVVKVALVADAALFDVLERDAEQLVSGPAERLLPVVRAAVHAKLRIVADDERDTGRRMLLNFGHTIGHALEAATAYTAHLHGEAVAIGMVEELAATERLGLTPKLATRVEALLARLGLPTRAQHGDLLPYILADKKRSRAIIRLPVVSKVGEGAIHDVDPASLLQR